ncbi:hypothetical protein [Streptomyces sp. Ac-502]|uniref:hypothetical protein n=1 Tax=Streptomyces sp. Ac-502 TaxID=3342801 RepID=UPI003862B9FB
MASIFFVLVQRVSDAIHDVVHVGRVRGRVADVLADRVRALSESLGGLAAPVFEDFLDGVVELLPQTAPPVFTHESVVDPLPVDGDLFDLAGIGVRHHGLELVHVALIELGLVLGVEASLVGGDATIAFRHGHLPPGFSAL